MTAEHGRLLMPYARLLLAVAALGATTRDFVAELPKTGCIGRVGM